MKRVYFHNGLIIPSPGGALVMFDEADACVKRLTAERDALQLMLNAVEEENDRLRSALRYYADKEHFHFDDPDRWDSVSGEPMNILCHDEEGYVEDGSIALAALEKRP